MNIESRLAALGSHSAAIDLHRLPTNTTTANHPVHRWFNFIAGFSPEFVSACLAMAGASRGLTLLDPFAGCGTAPTASRLLGVRSVGYDPHPFFAIIGEAKSNAPTYWPDLPEILRVVKMGLNEPVHGSLSPAASDFLGKMFDEESLRSLVGAKEALRRAGLADNPLAVLIVSRMLDHCCFAATDGIYKAPTSAKKAVSPDTAFAKVETILRQDAVTAQSGAGLARLYTKSSERMEELEDGSVDLIVTSPPYLNNFDFAEMTRMYLYFWGLASSWGEITDKVRSRLVTNTTTALKGRKQLQEAYRESLPEAVRRGADEAVQTLGRKRKEKAGKKEYDFLVYPYLSQMQAIIRECARVLKKGGRFHMMVSDAALYGVHLPAPHWLAQIMRNCGLEDVECEMVRRRGHRWVLAKREGAANGLGEYYVHGVAS